MNTKNNGFPKQEQINFPVSFDLKVIMISTPDPNVNIEALEPVLSELMIPYSNWAHKPSGKGTYTSYSVKIKVKDQKTLTELYKKLKLVPGVKMAL